MPSLSGIGCLPSDFVISDKISFEIPINGTCYMTVRIFCLPSSASCNENVYQSICNSHNQYLLSKQKRSTIKPTPHSEVSRTLHAILQLLGSIEEMFVQKQFGSDTLSANASKAFASLSIQ